MKSILTVAIAAFLISGTLSAQHVNIGIKGGLNLYNVHTEDQDAGDIKPGFNLGLLGHIHLAKQWAFQPEVVFSVQGTKSSIGELDSKLNLNYVNVPLLIQYMFDNGFRIEAGPQIGFLASAKAKVGNEDAVDVKDNFKSVEFGVGAGLSYVHPPSGVGVDVRYNLGLTNITEDDDFVSTNQGFQIGLFYLFAHQ